MEPLSIFCDLHSIEYCKTNKELRIFNVVIRPHPETQSKIIQKLNQIKIDLRHSKKTVMTESFKILNLVIKSIQSSHIHLNNLLKKCDDLLKTATQEEIYSLYNEDSLESVLKLAPNEVEYKLKLWNGEKILINYDEIRELISKFKDVSNLDPFKYIKNRNISSKEIMFFREDTKQLVVHNLISQKSTVKDQTTLPMNMHCALSVCILPNQSIFCYGNYFSGITFIIDQEKNIKLLPDGKANGWLHIHYFENHVYAIGGNYNLAEKFNLIGNTWKSCAPITFNFNFQNSRSALLGYKIVIVGYHFEKVIRYDIKQNNYIELANISLSVGIHKFIFSAKSRIYIGQFQINIFESNKNDLTRWSCISSHNPVGAYYQMSCYVLLDDSVFLLTYPHSLYEFKLKTKEIVHVKDL